MDPTPPQDTPTAGGISTFATTMRQIAGIAAVDAVLEALQLLADSAGDAAMARRRFAKAHPEMTTAESRAERGLPPVGP
jgi:hypothetical protein